MSGNPGGSKEWLCPTWRTCQCHYGGREVHVEGGIGHVGAGGQSRALEAGGREKGDRRCGEAVPYTSHLE